MQKMEKDYFSNWNDSKRIFGPEIDENEIQVLEVLKTKHLKQSFPVFAAVNKSIMSVKSIFGQCLAQCSEGPSCTFSPVPSCHGRTQDRYDSLHMAEASFSRDSGVL